jgi:hypothetical protein
MRAEAEEADDVLKANKKYQFSKCKFFYGYLLKTLHFGNNRYVYPIDFKGFLCFSADPGYFGYDIIPHRQIGMIS